MNPERGKKIPIENTEDLQGFKTIFAKLFVTGGHIQLTEENIFYSDQPIKQLEGGPIEKTALAPVGTKRSSKKIATLYIIPERVLPHYYDNGFRKAVAPKEESILHEVMDLMQESIDSTNAQEPFSVADFLLELSQELTE